MADILPRDAGEAAIAWISKVLGDVWILQGDTSPDFASSDSVKKSFTAYLDRSKRSDGIVLASQAWSHVANQSDLIRHLKEQNAELSAKLIGTQEALIKVQGQIVECKDEQFRGISTAVQLSVKDSMKKEISSYSSVLQSPGIVTPQTISASTAQRVVKTVAEEEARAKNVMVFGLPEADSEDLGDRIGELFGELQLGEKPHVETARIGNKRTDVIRPVQVKLRNKLVVAQIRRKAGGLKNSENFKTVYLSPDRSPELRNEHRKLVVELKKRCQEDPEKVHFIRDGAIVSSERRVVSVESG